MPSPQDPLDSLLDAWGEPPVPGPLAPEVWRRLATRPRPAPRPRRRSWNALDFGFGRLSFAATFIAACVLLGLFLAELRVSRLRGERDRQLAESYLRLIDPLLAESAPPRAAPPPS